MRKLWIWITILVASALLVLLWNWQGMLPFGFTGNPSVPSQARQVPPSFSLPKLDADRLMTDLEALAFNRYRQDDRQRARDYIVKTLEVSGWTVQQQTFPRGVNLYAERVGTDPALPAVLLGAHYDSVEPSVGADDNATGVATVLEAARLLGQQATPRTLQLVLFDLEEEGLLGSKAFVESLSNGSLVGAIVLDMVGYACETAGCQSYPPVLPIHPPTDRGNFLAVLGDQGHAQLLDSFVNQSDLPQVLTLAIPTFGGLAPDMVRSDHAPFWKKGIGAVLVTDTANFRNPHYHQPSDTLETIDPDFFAGSAQLIINAVARLLQS